MKIHNTLTNREEEFIPLEEGKVKMYVCGPTVYNFMHIGNARPIIIFDTVRRYFEYKGYDVNYVSNFTDVDDKIIKRANEEGVPAVEISEKYIEEAKKDMEGLNVLPATKNPKATEEIEGMIEMIEELIKKGHAYAKNGSVYFKTRSFDSYGKLSNKNIDDLESGARIAINDEKDDPLDFVLWKPKKEGEPFWMSPWGEGRPGWHIECSVMSKKYLGEQIDIHAGGEDLIFPHHENEIAQSEAANGKNFARYWMHNGYLRINNEKMSKSLGNFITIRDVSKEYDLGILRFFMLGAHYRGPINFSHELMEAAKTGLERIINAVANLDFLLENAIDKNLTETEKEVYDKALAYKTDFEAAMEADFNTADAVSAVFNLVKLANSEISAESSKELVKKVREIIVLLSDVLGVKVVKEKEILDEEIEALIKERTESRKAKNFARADEIREILTSKGIVLEDTREGVKWKRI
ncbi:MAG: cysteine--tRNA ligase [Catonella sp.]|uniref:cysteine--tRNA ligase n=1 Tax=Catonella sp. TaxID=2382125 RepID=UPI003FA022A3